jgi:hypothetical protein
VYAEQSAVLLRIADHGYAAADAMKELLAHPTPYFPMQDAITVLRFVHASGNNLRGHEVMRALETIATTSADPLFVLKLERLSQILRAACPAVTDLTGRDRMVPGPGPLMR